MQLILDTETTIHIKEKMATYEESLNSSIENLKSDVVNGNKENIESQKNIINSPEELTGEDLKQSVDHSSENSTNGNNIIVNDKKEDNENRISKTEDLLDVQIPCENGTDHDLVNIDKVNNDITVETEISNSNNICMDEGLSDIVVSEDVETQVSDDKKEEIAVIPENNKEPLLETDISKQTTVCDKVTTKGDIEDIRDVDDKEDSAESVNEIVEDKETNRNNAEIIKDIPDENPPSEKNIDLKSDADLCEPESNIETVENNCDENKICSEKNNENRTAEDSIVVETPLVSDAKVKILNVHDINEMAANKSRQSIENNITNTNDDVLDLDDCDIVVETSDETLDGENKTDKVESKGEVLDLNNFNENLDTGAKQFVENDKKSNVDDSKKECLHVDIRHDKDETKEKQLDDNKKNNILQDNKGEILDVDDFIDVVEDKIKQSKEKEAIPAPKAPICKLSNTLDILSDDDDDPPQTDLKDDALRQDNTFPMDKQCINIEDDDDIMLIDEDTLDSAALAKNTPEDNQKMDTDDHIDNGHPSENSRTNNVETMPDVPKVSEAAVPATETLCEKPEQKEKSTEVSEERPDVPVAEIKEKQTKPLVAETFLKTYKNNLADMTREELEEFCIVRIVEGIVDRSNLSEIKTKLKTLAQNIEEYKKKAMMLSKQNRDLQLVLKSVQEEQKKKSDTAIIPLKITRSVGMQVLMTEKSNMRKKITPSSPVNNSNILNKALTNRNPNSSPRPQKPSQAPNNTPIPVPRLVPAAANPAVKPPNVTAPVVPNNNGTKNNGVAPQTAINGMKVTSPPQKTAEKRNRLQSVTVDLTDDEPPAKIIPRSSPVPPVRLVSNQNLMTRPQFTQALNSPRKVYIPVSGPQSQNIRPGQTIMLKSVPPLGPRVRSPAPPRMPQNAVKMTRLLNNGLARHPAPLPECLKQYQPPNWKALPPAPDLKLAKVENGIVISWKIEGYHEDSYETIASYQLYAYQETSSPPNTSLWKKIGDVKALPLPMACTLTQFMAGFKYYFAVRAVDVRSRLGPFSLPGSILLLNKM